jgi:archaellum component FlaF (FlaF/FlaG flagellin family)
MLYEIGEDSAAELGRFYTRTGDVDILAGKDGSIYIVGGSSSHVVKELTVHGYDSSSEKAVLNIWKYSKQTGVVNGRTAQIPFESARGYKYQNTGLSKDGESIYTFFIAGDSLVRFTYDISLQEWTDDMQTTSLAGSVDKSFVFCNESGASIVYSSGTGVYEVNDTGTQLLSNVSELKDAYIDVGGQLYLLYTANEKVYLSSNGNTVEIVDMAVDDYGRVIQDEEGKLYILSMEKGKPAAMKILCPSTSGDQIQIVKTIQLDTAAVAIIPPIISVPRGGSELDSTVSLVFPAPYRISNHWYYADITLR